MPDMQRSASGSGIAPEPVRSENLALLYQGILTAIVRLQSGRQPIVDPDAFQKRMEGLVSEISREAIKLGYRDEDVQSANYAVIAFLDETIQRSDDPNRVYWSPMQAKLYSQVVAGEGVFDRLKALQTRRDSPDLADVLEVYYLCLLLGYEGRYGLHEESELHSLMDELRARIDRIRGPRDRISPDGWPGDSTEPSGPPRAAARDRWKIAMLAAICLACVTWILLKVLLSSYAHGVVGQTAS